MVGFVQMSLSVGNTVTLGTSLATNSFLRTSEHPLPQRASQGPVGLESGRQRGAGGSGSGRQWEREAAEAGSSRVRRYWEQEAVGAGGSRSGRQPEWEAAREGASRWPRELEAEGAVGSWRWRLRDWEASRSRAGGR